MGLNHTYRWAVGVWCAVLMMGCSERSGVPGPVGSDSPDDAPRPPDTQVITADQFNVQTMAGGFDTIWDLAMDPSGKLWATERRGIVSVVDTASGQVQTVGRIDGVFERSESGLMGMALHPDFPNPAFVYFVHSYDSGGGGIGNRLIRMTYDGTALVNREILLDRIPGNFNHNGARLAVGPDRLLYMTTGDAQSPNLAVEVQSLAGKVLRLTLDGQVPGSNPFKTEIYSFGHRNPQGLVFHPVTGALYATEHGPSANDEVNRIAPGRNHGWPEVHGYCHDEDIGLAEMQYCRENNVMEPIAIWTPTIAPSGADFYFSDVIAAWKGDLLFTTLKDAALYRVVLSSDGSKAISQEALFKDEFGRLRDVLVGPRGEIYLATSNRDGRGRVSGSDRIVRLSFKQ